MPEEVKPVDHSLYQVTSVVRHWGEWTKTKPFSTSLPVKRSVSRYFYGYGSKIGYHIDLNMTCEAPVVDRASLDPRYDKLFRDIEVDFDALKIPTNKWYLTTLGAITSSAEPSIGGQLYLYLLSQPLYSTPDGRKALTMRSHEVILKAVALLGIPKPAEATIAIA